MGKFITVNIHIISNYDTVLLMADVGRLFLRCQSLFGGGCNQDGELLHLMSYLLMYGFREVSRSLLL